MRERVIMTQATPEEAAFEHSIRPSDFDSFVGQGKIVENLKLFIAAARARKESLDHVILCGPPGLGKTTLAYIIAREMGADVKSTSGNVLVKPGDLAGLLTNLKQGDLLFIDEIHRINPAVEEYLYPAMEDYKIDIMIDSGPSARSIKLDLKPFTLVGATTRVGMLTSPMVARFGINFRLDYYQKEELQRIIERSAVILKVKISAEAALEIGSRCRATPRIANRLLRRCRDVAQVNWQGVITPDVVGETLARLEVDPLGLDQMDRRILAMIIDNYGGGPVGVNTIAVAVNEEPETIEDYYEPFLIQSGLLKRTPRGREVTQTAYRHLNLKPPKAAGPQTALFPE
jgi:holliday junction DNA helicase RuvB